MANTTAWNPDGDRVMTALHASWEAEGCSLAALRIVRRMNIDDDQIYALKALIGRLRDLSVVSMTALGDEAQESFDDVCQVLACMHPHEQAAGAGADEDQ